MKKLFVSKSFIKKIALILVVIILFQVVVAKPVRADIGGTLLSPIVNLVVFLADGVISVLQNSLTDVGEPFVNITLNKELAWWEIGLAFLGGLILVVGAIALTIVSAGTAWAVVVAAVAPIMLVGGGTGIVLSFNPQLMQTLSDIVFGDSLVYSNIFISPEALLRNQIPLFDVNFFTEANVNANAATASLANTIRGIISGVYRTVRDVCIVAMLIIIVYIAIRMLLSLSPKEKSRYKEGFTNCLVGLVLIIVMHYIMAISTSLISEISNGVIYGSMIYDCNDPDNFDVNQAVATDSSIIEKYTTGETIGIKGERIYNALVNDDGTVKDGFDKVSVGSEEKSVCIVASNFLEIARYKAQKVYDVDENGENKQENWTHIGWAFAYIMLVVLTVSFVWMYGKRLLYIAALTMFAPIVGVMYPINRVDGSRAQTLNMWLKEYMGNLIIQPFHMLLYSVLIGGAIYMSLNNPIYIIVALMGMSFIEKLLKDLLGIQDTRAGSLGNALRDTNRAIKTATDVTKKTANAARRGIDRGVNGTLRAADRVKRHNSRRAEDDYNDEESARTPRIEARNPGELPDTEHARRNAQGDAFDQDTEDRYLVDHSFRRTDDSNADRGDDEYESIPANNQPDRLYSSNDEWAEQLREQGLGEDEIAEARRIMDGAPEPLALDSQPESLYSSDDEWAEQLREQGLGEDEIADAMRIRNGEAEQLPIGMNEDEMGNEALDIPNTVDTGVEPKLGATEDGMEMVDESLYMPETNNQGAAPKLGDAQDGMEMTEGLPPHVSGGNVLTGVPSLPDDRDNDTITGKNKAGSNPQLVSPPQFLDEETMRNMRDVSQARMNEFAANGGQRIKTSSGITGVVNKDGTVIAADFTQIGGKKSSPKSADAKANQIPMQNAVGQNTNVNRTIGENPKLSVVTSGGTSGSSGNGGSNLSGGATSQSGSAGSVSKVDYKGGTGAKAQSSKSGVKAPETTGTSTSGETQQAQVTRTGLNQPQPSAQASGAQGTSNQPQVSAATPGAQSAENQPQVSAATPGAQSAENQPQVSATTPGTQGESNQPQADNKKGNAEKVVEGVATAASVVGGVAGTAGKVAGNVLEGVLNMAVDGVTGSPGQVANDAMGAITGSSRAIGDASIGGRGVEHKGMGQLSDDARYLMREGNTEQRAQFVETLCQFARTKYHIVIDKKEDKRNIARALKDTGDKNDKTINTLIIQAIIYKRNGQSRENYEKYINSKGVSSSVKNVLLKLYDDTQK